MKRIALFCFAVFIFGCSSHTGFETYRNNPFQFPYPEYHMKAETVAVHSGKLSGDVETIEVFGIRFDIEKRYVDQIRKRGGTYAIKKDGKLRFIVFENKEILMGCKDATVRKNSKDYCSAFASTKEYFEKLFLLTPEDLSKEKYHATGNRWIVHQKGYMFQDIEKITIYKKDGADGFTIFREDYKPAKRHNTKVGLLIFPDKIKETHINMGFVIKDETLIQQILTTMRSANKTNRQPQADAERRETLHRPKRGVIDDR